MLNAMRKIAAIVSVSLFSVAALLANAIEVEDADSGVWAIFITDTEAPVPSVDELIASGVSIDPSSSAVTEYETFEDGLIRLSSAIAEKMASILYVWGPDSYMGVYQYDGAEGKYAMAAFVPEGKRTALDALASGFFGGLAYDEAVMTFEDMMQE